MPQYNARPIAKKFEGQSKTFDDSRLWRQLELGSNTGTAFAQVDSVAKTVKVSGFVHPKLLLDGMQSTIIIPKQSDWGFSVPATTIVYFDDTVGNGNGGPTSVTISSDGHGNLVASNKFYSNNEANALFVFTKSISNGGSDLKTIFTDLSPITFSIK